MIKLVYNEFRRLLDEMRHVGLPFLSEISSRVLQGQPLFSSTTDAV